MNSNSKRKMELVSSSSDMVRLDSAGHCSSYESSVINSRLSHYNSATRDKKPNLTGSIWDMDDDLPSNYPSVKVSLNFRDEDVYIVPSDDEIEVLEVPDKSRPKNKDGSRKRQRTSSLCDANQNDCKMRVCHESENENVKIIEVQRMNPCSVKGNDILSDVEVIETDNPVEDFMTHRSNTDSPIKQIFQTVNNDKPIITSAYSLGRMYGSQMKLSSTIVRMIPPDGGDISQPVLEDNKAMSSVVLDEAPLTSSLLPCVEVSDSEDLIPVSNSVTECSAEVESKPDVLTVGCIDSEDLPEILGSFIPAKNLNDSSQSKPGSVRQKSDKVNVVIQEHGKMVFAEKRKGTIENQAGGKRKESFNEWTKARMSSSTKASNAARYSKVPSQKLTSPSSAQKSPIEEVRERAGLISTELSKHVQNKKSQPEIILLDVEEKRPEVIHIVEEESAKRQKTPDILEIPLTQRPRNQRQQTYPVDWRTQCIGKRPHTASSNYNAEYERRNQTNVEKEWMEDLGVCGTSKRHIEAIETPLRSPLSLAEWHSSSSSRDSTPARPLDPPRQPNSSPKYSQHQPKIQNVPRQPRTSSRYINNPYMPRNGKSSVKVIVTVFNREPENHQKLTLSLRDFEELRITFEAIERLVPGVDFGENRVHYSAKAVVCLLRFACNITFTLPSWEVAVEVYALAHHYHLTQLCTDCVYYFNRHPIELDEVLEVSKLALNYKIDKFLAKFRNFSRGFNQLGLKWDKIPKYYTPHCYISSDTYVECTFNVPLMESTMTGLDRARTDDIRNDLDFTIQFGAVKITSLQLKLDVPSTFTSSTHISVHVSKDNHRVANMELNRKLASIMKIDFDKDVTAKAGSRLTITIMLEELPFKFCSVLREERLSTRQFAVTMSSSKKDQDGCFLFFVENVSFNE